MLGQETHENMHILLQIHLVLKQIKVKPAVKVSPSNIDYIYYVPGIGNGDK